jgi:hypothetical protein
VELAVQRALAELDFAPGELDEDQTERARERFTLLVEQSFDDRGLMDAINDLACRFNPRTTTGDACTRNSQQDSMFVVASTRVQFCPSVGVGSEIEFPLGDTRVTARVTDIIGQPGPAKSIIIRVTE